MKKYPTPVNNPKASEGSRRYTKSVEGLPHYYKETRPWGNFERFTENESSTVKIITVEAGEAFSLQSHTHRSEFWYVLDGQGSITVGESTAAASAGMSFFIKAGHKHRAEASPSGHLVFLEIAFGTFDEGDIRRFEDRYGRA